MAIEFLGHKKNLLDFIVATVQRNVGTAPSDIADLFCGTAAVSAAFKQRGYRVIANDNLVMCSTFAEAALLNDGEPSFAGILPLIEADRYQNGLLPFTPYEVVLSHLNELPPREGFIQRNFSPASKRYCEVERMYYTEANAGRMDSIRATLHEWEGLLTRGERALLLSDLIRAANAVSNIAGTYGCYLKRWKSRALQPLTLKRSSTISGALNHQVYCTDANKLAREVSSTIVYADPPYTKRQYSAYYHLPETIAVGDEPIIEGSTGLRPWEEKSSDYCYRKKAPYALEDLVSSIDCAHFFLSYNEDGQVPHDTILDILSRHGRVQVFEAQSRRYKSSDRPHKGRTVLERLYYLTF